MSTVLNFGRDSQGYNTFAPNVSTNKFSATLGTSDDDTITVPSNYENWNVSFSFTPGSNVWVAFDAAAAAPAGNTFAATSSELLPGARVLTAGTTINILNTGADDADVGVMMYAIS